MRESEKWKWSHLVVSDFSDPMDYTVHRILQARILEEVAFPFANPEIEPRCPAMQVDSLSLSH